MSYDNIYMNQANIYAFMNFKSHVLYRDEDWERLRKKQERNRV